MYLFDVAFVEMMTSSCSICKPYAVYTTLYSIFKHYSSKLIALFNTNVKCQFKCCLLIKNKSNKLLLYMNKWSLTL